MQIYGQTDGQHCEANSCFFAIAANLSKNVILKAKLMILT